MHNFPFNICKICFNLVNTFEYTIYSDWFECNASASMCLLVQPFYSSSPPPLPPSHTTLLWVRFDLCQLLRHCMHMIDCVHDERGLHGIWRVIEFAHFQSTCHFPMVQYFSIFFSPCEIRLLDALFGWVGLFTCTFVHLIFVLTAFGSAILEPNLKKEKKSR